MFGEGTYYSMYYSLLKMPASVFTHLKSIINMHLNFKQIVYISMLCIHSFNVKVEEP